MRTCVCNEGMTITYRQWLLSVITNMDDYTHSRIQTRLEPIVRTLSNHGIDLACNILSYQVFVSNSRRTPSHFHFSYSPFLFVCSLWFSCFRVFAFLLFCCPNLLFISMYVLYVCWIWIPLEHWLLLQFSLYLQWARVYAYPSPLLLVSFIYPFLSSLSSSSLLFLFFLFCFSSSASKET